MIPVVLAVGGSDPTGGAGIQADLKTLTRLGVYGAAALTCVTVQHSTAVTRILPLDPDLVAEQVRAVLMDMRVTHVKIGMVGTLAIAKALARVLERFNGVVVLDPVLTATAGQELTDEGGLEGLLADLLPMVSVLTPNADELVRLCAGAGIQGLDRPAGDLARDLLHKYPGLDCVLAKGGHPGTRSTTLEDLCVFRDQVLSHTHPAIVTRNSHGTGCTLASAFCAFHVKTKKYEESFIRSINFLQRLLRQSANQPTVRAPQGSGPMLHCFPSDRN